MEQIIISHGNNHMVFHNNNLREDLSYSFPPPRCSIHLLVRHELEDEAVLVFACERTKYVLKKSLQMAVCESISFSRK